MREKSATEEAQEISQVCAALQRETAKMRAEIAKTRADLQALKLEVSAGFAEWMHLRKRLDEID
jgi:hypothetical protein